jgi:hypothetical protein
MFSILILIAVALGFLSGSLWLFTIALGFLLVTMFPALLVAIVICAAGVLTFKHYYRR